METKMKMRPSQWTQINNQYISFSHLLYSLCPRFFPDTLGDLFFLLSISARYSSMEENRCSKERQNSMSLQYRVKRERRWTCRIEDGTTPTLSVDCLWKPPLHPLSLLLKHGEPPDSYLIFTFSQSHALFLKLNLFIALEEILQVTIVVPSKEA